MNIIVSSEIKEKLSTKHDVEAREVEQCFENKCGLYLIDDREAHRTAPPTLWFIAPTNKGRVLKVIFIINASGSIYLKSAYEPEPESVEIYDELGR